MKCSSPPRGEDEFDPKICRIQIDVYIRPRLPTAENVIFFEDDQRVWDHRYAAGIPESLAGMTSDQLKATTTQCIFRIQALAVSMERTRRHELTTDENFEAMVQRSKEESDLRREIWHSNLWPKAFAIREELCRRIYGEPPYPEDRNSSVAIMHGMLTGPYPIAEAAADLRRLLMRLI